MMMMMKIKKHLRRRYIWNQQDILTCRVGTARLHGAPLTWSPDVPKFHGPRILWCCSNFFYGTPEAKEISNNSIYEAIRSKRLHKCLYLKNSAVLNNNILIYKSKF